MSEWHSNHQYKYGEIGNFIVENNGNDTEEEWDQIATFKSYNFDQENSYSHTSLKTVRRQVLTTKIGEPEDNGSNGLIF